MAIEAAPTATRRWGASLPLLVAGGAAIVAGGLVAAITGPTSWEHGSWVAAFLVLVAGVAQIGVAAGQALLASDVVSRAVVAVECLSWNVGCLLVVAGTLLSSPTTVTIGSAPLVAVLGMSTVAVSRSGGRPSRWLWSYRTLLIVLLVSIPVGIGLAWTRR